MAPEGMFGKGGLAMGCPACGAEVGGKRIMRHRECSLYHCRACDLMFWHPRQDPSPGWYEASATGELSSVSPDWSSYSCTKRFLRDLPARGGKLLDVGCGRGYLLSAARKPGQGQTGIDINAASIEDARSRYQLDDVHALTLEEFLDRRSDEKFDVITMMQYLEHLENPRLFLALMKGALRPGGYAVCGVPNRHRWRWLNKTILDVWDLPPNHFTLWSKQSLASLFDDAGLQVEIAERDPLLNWDYGWCSWAVSKLGVDLLVRTTGRTVLSFLGRGRRAASDATAPASMARVPFRPGLKVLLTLYLRGLQPLLGLVFAPLALLLRREGSEIYLLAKLE